MCFSVGDRFAVYVAQGKGEGSGHHGGCGRADFFGLAGPHQFFEVSGQLLFDDAEGTIFALLQGIIFACVCRVISSVVHLDVSIGICVCCRACAGGARRRWVEPFCLLGMACNDGNLVRIVAGQVGIYKHQKICNCGR